MDLPAEINVYTLYGRIELDGDNLFINNVNPTCVKESEQVLEVHRDYIDIHILLEGKERCITSPASGGTLRRLAVIDRVKHLSDTALRA